MNVIAKDIEKVVERMRAKYFTADSSITADSRITVDGGGLPAYYYGHPLEINNRLLEKNKDKEEKYLKYPAVFLKLDAVERIDGLMINYTLNLAIVNETKRNYNAEQRLNNVFIPILYPLYDLFIEELRNCGLFTFGPNLVIPRHTKIDRFFYGTPGQNKNNESFFSDPLDAIEIVDLQISAHKRSGVKCTKPI